MFALNYEWAGYAPGSYTYDSLAECVAQATGWLQAVFAAHPGAVLTVQCVAL